MAHLVISPQLAAEKWYHGLLPREDIKTMIRKNGEFLVRTTEPNAGEARTLVLSAMQKEELEDMGLKHMLIKWTPEGKCYIEKFTFDTVSAMVEHHMRTAESVMKNQEVILKLPLPRQHWELEHEDIQCTKKLGEGAFGEVHKGTLKQKNGKPSVDVAIKLAKLEALTKVQIKEIMKEARLMRNFDHPNVVKFFGVAAGQEPLMVVMELATCGALDSYLQKHEQPLNVKMEMCLQSAWGIDYLHKQPVLHRDIAARNCLYGAGQVKISDFGLTREGTVYQMNPKNKVPIRWLAPETLKTAIYTQKTDVYSFGIMCWEIFNNGIEPYPGMTVAEVFGKVREGYRMPLPPAVNPEIQKIIEDKCWAENPNDRFSMSDVAKHMARNLGVTRPNFEAMAAAAKAEREKAEEEERKALADALKKGKGGKKK